mmetsp:Transcript_19673/g.25346  ORF Transcript_19673/g.25346 Transcript_19673/m.25346 type:complete len:165 (+) Transcript_19673:107-601(+)
MLSRASTQLIRRVATRTMSSEVAAPSTITLNFALPHETIYSAAAVHRVIIPGVEGEYGVGPGHVPVVAQLKPGVLQVLHEEGSDAEKYFVAGGYAMTHGNSTTDVVCPEAVKLDDLDSAAVSKQFEAAKSAYGSASAGTPEQAEAQIDMEVNKAMGLALGLNLA